MHLRFCLAATRTALLAATRVALLVGATAGAAVAQPAAPAAAPNPNAKFGQALTGLGSLNTASIVYGGLGTAVISSGKGLQPVSRFHVAINYGMEMLSVEVEQMEKPRRIAQYLAGGRAWDVVEKKLVSRPDAVAERLRLLFMTPHGVMKAAQDAGSRRVMANEMVAGRLTTTMTFPAGKAMLKAYFDDKATITRVHTLPGDGALGKSVVEFLYSDYRNYDTLSPPVGPTPGGAASAMAYGGIPFPSRIIQKMDGVIILDLGITEVTPNAGLMLDVPPSVERAHSRK